MQDAIFRLDLDPVIRKHQQPELLASHQHSLGQVIDDPGRTVPLDLLPLVAGADSNHLGSASNTAFDARWRVLKDDAPVDGLAYPVRAGQIWLGVRLAARDIVGGDEVGRDRDPRELERGQSVVGRGCGEV